MKYLRLCYHCHLMKKGLWVRAGRSIETHSMVHPTRLFSFLQGCGVAFGPVGNTQIAYPKSFDSVKNRIRRIYGAIRYVPSLVIILLGFEKPETKEVN